MHKRRLGRTDLLVTQICLGSMTWGQQNTEAEGHAQMDLAFSRGVNFIDTAELYPIPPKAETQGRTEKIIGSWMKAKGNLDKVILASKVDGLSPRNQVLAVRPTTLEARITLSRLPLAFIQLPMILSVRPCVSALGGIG